MSARKRSPLPEYEPQLALLVDDAPEGDDWLHELKFDGYRIGVRIDRGKVALLSRRAKDWTEAFPTVVAGARKIDATTALLDGELAGVLPDGRTSLHAMGGSNLVYFAFDLLHVDGEDLFDLPLDQRKLRLAALLGDAPPAPFRFVEHHVGDGARFFKEACAMRLEGIVSKARAAPYKAGARNASWRKVKCVLRQEFVIGGYEHSVVGGLGSLWLGTYDNAGQLEFAGKVGTGFQREAPALMKKLAGMKRATTPFDVGVPAGAAKVRDAHWVEPTLVCEVAFMEWTGHGHIRHPSFQGMRADKKPRDVKREVASEPE